MERARFGPQLIGLFPVLVFLVCTVPFAASSPWLSWLVVLPLVCAVWVVRARVVADRDGLVVCNGLGWARYAWDEVEGFDVQPRRPVRLLLRSGRGAWLTALSRRELRALLSLAPRPTS